MAKKKNGKKQPKQEINPKMEFMLKGAALKKARKH